jgi:hypothetical protein
MKSGNLNFLEPSGPLQACNGTALPLPLRRLDHHIVYATGRYSSTIFFSPMLLMKENGQFHCPAAFSSSKQQTFSCTGNKVRHRRKMDASVADEDPHICWSVDFITVTLLIKVPHNTFCFSFFIVNDLLKSNTNYCHVTQL